MYSSPYGFYVTQDHLSESKTMIVCFTSDLWLRQLLVIGSSTAQTLFGHGDIADNTMELCCPVECGDCDTTIPACRKTIVS